MTDKVVKTKREDRVIEEQIKELRVVIKSVMSAMEHIYAVRFDMCQLEKPLSNKVRTLSDWREVYNNEGEIKNV